MASTHGDGGPPSKRRASNDLTEQRLAKRFDLLDIDNRATKHKLYVPVSPSIAPARPRRSDGLDGDRMSLDDSKHKVYIYDLDAELSDAESAPDTPIFIPDIEKHLNRLPKAVLMGNNARAAAQNMQMVLYGVPASLSVAEQQDGVRKAILESRARQRERAGWGERGHGTLGDSGHGILGESASTRRERARGRSATLETETARLASPGNFGRPASMPTSTIESVAPYTTIAKNVDVSITQQPEPDPGPGPRPEPEPEPEPMDVD